MSRLRDLAQFVRLLATLQRTGAVEPVMAALGAPIGRRRLAAILLTPLEPFGLSGEETLPPVARALSALGPSYVKFGQVLSTRPDLTGEALSRDLRHLQDKLPPFSGEAARRTIEEQLGAPIDQLFAEFEAPVAAASIAQVHRARLPDGRAVAVKVLRPDVERAFARDISAFYFVAQLLERLIKQTRRLRPLAAVEHFESVVLREMDLRLEAAAGSEFSDLTQSEEGFATPQMIWPLTSRRVLTTTWVEGVNLNDLEALDRAGADRRELATRLVRLFLQSALRDGYFHADMHPGNLKLGANGVVYLYDFGIMGRIDQRTRRIYAEILFSYLTRDYHRGARAHFEAGYVAPDQDLDEFAMALRSIGEPIVGQDASKIAMGRLLEQLFDVTARFGMETRPELLLLQRAMVVVEGVARRLDPSFNMWAAARPVVERWMQDNLGPAAVARDLAETAKTLARLGPRLPEFADRLLVLAAEWRIDGEAAKPPAPPAPPPGTGGFWAGLMFGVLAGGLGAVLALIAL